MRTVTKKHVSVRNGIARFAQVTVGLLASEDERIRRPLLSFGHGPIENPNPKEQAILDAAFGATREEEVKRGVMLCVMSVDCVEVDAHPEAARLAALSAISELVGQK